jgi:hypothetical protein
MLDRQRGGKPALFGDSGTVVVGVRLHPATRDRLEAFAAEQGVTLSEAARRVFASWERQFAGREKE